LKELYFRLYFGVGYRIEGKENRPNGFIHKGYFPHLEWIIERGNEMAKCCKYKIGM